MRGVLISVIIVLSLILVTSYSTFDLTGRMALKDYGVETDTIRMESLNLFSEEWDCSSGLTCTNNCEGMTYQRMWGELPATKEYEYTFSLPDSNRYTCTVTLKTCCYNNDETDETTDVYNAVRRHADCQHPQGFMQCPREAARFTFHGEWLATSLI
jgi:hypothetical protein